MSDDELNDWIDTLREVDLGSAVGICSDNDYALIGDRDRNLWHTETLPTGEQVKISINKDRTHPLHEFSKELHDSK